MNSKQSKHDQIAEKQWWKGNLKTAGRDKNYIPYRGSKLLKGSSYAIHEVA